MSRKKLPDDKKKTKIGLSIDKILLELFDKNVQNRSKYIENLIRSDMKKRGKDISQNF
ncbi:hypothetical protein M0Q50_02635 [bacterium]|jgi:metal-responsive CopG/Arc/MetJ family transcriptional regulator|nr:hypothetical protein [bacterium]